MLNAHAYLVEILFLLARLSHQVLVALSTFLLSQPDEGNGDE